MNYCISILIAYAAGIITATTYSIPFPNTAIAAIAILSLIVLHLSVAFRKSNNVTIPPLLILFFVLGIFLTSQSLQLPQNDHIYNKITTHTEAVVSGTMASAPITTDRANGKRTRFLVKTDTVRFANSATEEQTHGIIQLSLKGMFSNGLQPGDQLLIKTKLDIPRGFKTPGSFNYPRFLSDKSIWITGWTLSPLHITKLNQYGSRNRNILTYIKYLFHQIQIYPEIIRHRINSFLDSSLPPASSSLYKAILIGDKSSISHQTLENFKASGVMHILAISGMHMSLLFLVCTFLLSIILKRSKWCINNFPIVKSAALLSLIPLIFYALIAGMNTPVLRSLLMSSIFILTIVFNRPKSLINNIAIAALLILFYKPSTLYTVAFQLSFTAVLSIALFFPYLEKIRQRNIFPIADSLMSQGQSSFTLPPKHSLTHSTSSLSANLSYWIIAALLISTVATLSTAPLLAFHFNRISLASPVATILVEPLICLWALIWGLIACCLLPFSYTLASYIVNIGSLGLTASEWVVSQLASFSFSNFYLYTPSVWEIFFYYLLLFSVLHLKKSYARRLAILAMLAILMSLLIHHINNINSLSTRVSYLDVGQGTASVLQLPSGKTALIDGGGAVSESFNVGKDIIAPFLWHNRITRLDALVISHEHADHYNGLQFIIRHFKPRKIWINPIETNENHFNILLREAIEQQIPINIPSNGEILLNTPNVTLQCSLNPVLAEGGEKNSVNNKSLILKLIHRASDSKNKSISFLFPGDIDRNMEQNLMVSNNNWYSDVLLAAHHGSNFSNSGEFLHAVSPKFLVVSAGYKSRHFPALDLADRYQKRGIIFLSTKDDGTVIFETDGNSVNIQKSRFPNEQSMGKRLF